ncbi:MAG: helix-turn-helix domain-containing protein [Bacilli bacterium]
MNFQRLVETREDFNLKQKDIANILNITQQSYSLWENGTKIIPLKHLNSLCNYYNVSIDYMLGLSNTRHYDVINTVIDKSLIGKRLREFRIENNITQMELAKLLNTTHSTISAYESGKTTILTAFAYEICKKYNISMDYLCGRTNAKN